MNSSPFPLDQLQTISNVFISKLELARNPDGSPIVHNQRGSLKIVEAKAFFSFLDECKNFSKEALKKSSGRFKELKPINLPNLYFPEGMKIDGQLPGIRFSNSIFKGPFHCVGIQFLGIANFSSCNFHEQVDFSYSTFHSLASFDDCFFSDFNQIKKETPSLNFSLCQFKSTFSFKNCEIVGDVNFSKSKFLEEVNCNISSSSIVGNVDFSESKFLGCHKRAEFNFFSNTNIQCKFADSEFNSNIIFGGEIKSVDFSKSKFLGKCNFNSFWAKEFVKFDYALFNEDSYINISPITPGINISANIPVSFCYAKFKREATFVTSNEIDLEGCNFHFPPNFSLECRLKLRNLRKATFLALHTERDRDRYRELKKYYADEHARVEENFFWVLEQRTLANVQWETYGLLLDPFFSKLYFAVSHFGTSPSLPLLWLGFLFLIFWRIFAFFPDEILISNSSNVNWANSVNTPLGYAFQNLFSPFTLFTGRGVYVPETIWLVLLGSIQSVLSFSLITVFILAIRKRFRQSSE